MRFTRREPLLHQRDQRPAIELATVKSRAAEGEADLRWFDARYQIADCLTKHASRKSEEVLQQVINQARWRITAEETMLETRGREREREREREGERPRRFRQEASERADYAEATKIWRNANTEVRIVAHVPSA